MEPALAVGISVMVIMVSALLFERLKLPHILGVLAAGMLIGPYSPLAGADIMGVDFSKIIITDPSLVGVFAVIGSALILFGIGLEFSIIKLTQIGAFTFLAAAVKTGIVYLAGYSALFALGFTPQSSALVAIALSFSSTPIIIKLLEVSGKIRRPEVPFIISILIIEDLLAVFLLGLITNPAASATEYSFAISLIRVLVTFIFAYLVLSRLISRYLSIVSKSDELVILSLVGLVLIIGYLSEAVGLSFSVGAFLAGSIIAGYPDSRKIEEKVRPFNSLFATFFFFSIGLLVDLSAVLANLPLLALFIAVGIAVRFAAGGISAYFAGFTGRSACFTAAAFLSMSELSLLIMSQGSATGLVPAAFLGSFAFAIIASSFLSAWLLNRENGIYNFLQSLAPQIAVKNLRLLRSSALGMKRAVSESSRYYRVVERLPTISQHTDSLSTREQLVLTSKNSALLAAVSGSCYLAIFFSAQPFWSFLGQFFVFLLIAFFISSSLLLVNVKSAASSLVTMLQRSGSGGKYASAVHLFAAILFFMLCAAYVWAYYLSPESLAVILVLPSLAFAARSIMATFRAVSVGGAGRL